MTYFGITVPHWELLEQLRRDLQSDLVFAALFQQVQQHPLYHPHYQISQGLLFFKDRLFILDSSTLKVALLQEFHATLGGGHSGISKTYGRLRENVYWPIMQSNVTSFVKACAICQQTKHTTHLSYGLLQPLWVPHGVWEDIHGLHYRAHFVPKLHNNVGGC